VRPEPFKKWTRPFRLRRRLSNYLPDRSQRLDILCRPGPTDLVKLRREGRRLTMVLADREAMTNDREAADAIGRINRRLGNGQ
jgi:hypothetical protein